MTLCPANVMGGCVTLMGQNPRELVFLHLEVTVVELAPQDLDLSGMLKHLVERLRECRNTLI